VTVTPRIVGSNRGGSNAKGLRTYNQAVVLDAIRHHDSISRVEIAELTGLTSQTVTNICRRLLDQGIIEEAGKKATPLGKSRTALRPKPNGLFAIGVQFDPDASRAAILDLGGHVTLHRDFSPEPGADPGSVLELIASTVQDLLNDAGADPDRVLGIGVGVPGPLDPVKGMLFEPPHLHHWHDVPLRDTLEHLTGYPVVVDKDVSAAAVAEMWYGSGSGADTAAVIYVGTGIGLGVYTKGEIVRGFSGNAGEIGHIIVDPDGVPCVCGRRGCVGATSSSSSLVERLLPDASGVLEGMTMLTEGASQNPEWDRALDRAMDGLVELARTIAGLYDVNRLRLGGPMWDFFADRLTPARLGRMAGRTGVPAVHDISCAASELGADLGTIGAACLVFDNFLSPRVAQLPSISASSQPLQAAHRW
jgi:predicted NBD/HSP70 family sugar kinase